MHTILRPFLAGALVAAAVHPQGPLPVLPTDGVSAVFTAEPRVAPAFSDLTPIRRALAARLTGHQLDDAVHSDGSSVWLSSAPTMHKTVQRIAPHIVIRDVAVLHGAGLEPGLDALALLTAEHLWIWRFDPAEGSVLLEVAAGSGLGGALRLASDATAPGVLFAVAADGVSVLAEGRSGVAMGPTTEVYRGTAAILHAVACRWDADGSGDVAILTTNGLVVSEYGGGAPASLTVAGFAGAFDLERVRMNDGLHWVVGLCNGTQDQHVAVARSGLATATVPLGSASYIAISTGDLTNDALDELCLVSPEQETVAILINGFPHIPAGFVHGAASGFALQVAAPDPNRTPVFAAPLIADFDNDSDGDLLAVIESSGETDRGQVLLRGTIVPNDAITLSGPLRWRDVGAGSPGAQYEIRFHVNVTPGIANAAELQLWPVTLNAAGELAMAVRPDDTILLPPTGGQVDLLLDPAVFTGGYYALVVRPVVTGGSGSTVVLSGAPFVGGIFNRGDVESLFIMASGVEALIFATSPLDGTKIGGIGPNRPLPPLPPELGGPPTPVPPSGG